MQPTSRTLLEGIAQSCCNIAEDTSGMSRGTFLETRITRQAVERNLEIIGEGLIRLRRIDPETAAQITDVHRIIGLRNRLAHGYDQEIEDSLIWLISQTSVPALLGEIDALLGGASP